MEFINRNGWNGENIIYIVMYTTKYNIFPKINESNYPYLITTFITGMW